MAGRRFETEKVRLLVQEPPEWKIKLDKVSYAPGATITATREYARGGSKWDGRTVADGFFLYKPVPSSAKGVFFAGIFQDVKQYTYSATGDAAKPHTIGTSGSTVGRRREVWRRVRVVDCPVQDSLLDEQRVRDSLSAVWSASNGSDPNFANRRETPFGSYPDSITGEIVLRIFTDPNATPCTNTGSVISPIGVIADGHSHPFAHGDTLPTSLSSKCLVQGKYPAAYDAYVFGGPSDADWNNTIYQPRFRVPGGTFQLQTGPHIVIDANNVYVADPNTPTSLRKTNTKRYKRTTGPGCNRGEILL